MLCQSRSTRKPEKFSRDKHLKMPGIGCMVEGESRKLLGRAMAFVEAHAHTCAIWPRYPNLSFAVLPATLFLWNLLLPGPHGWRDPDTKSCQPCQPLLSCKTYGLRSWLHPQLAKRFQGDRRLIGAFLRAVLAPYWRKHPDTVKRLHSESPGFFPTQT